jgi:CxxC motif-containing protein (DUF1111 family)
VSAEEGILSMGSLVRLSLPGFDPVRGVVPEPTYGTQLQTQSISLAHQLRMVPTAAKLNPGIRPEVRVSNTWLQRDFVYPDGGSVRLRRPELGFDGWAYGSLDPDTQLGLRNSPPLYGLGLLERISDEDLLAAADPDDVDGDGISGRPNLVWDPERRRTVVGRFGLKANQATLRSQVAAALRDDLGITNPVFAEEVCTAAQPECLAAPDGRGRDGVEIANQPFEAMMSFARSIGVPTRRKAEHPMVLAGRERFYAAGCQDCHRPSFVTVEDRDQPHLSRQEIWPYTDLLLHDLGEDLADGRSDYQATGSEWRTPPLWGVGLARAVLRETGFLHDGRARTVEEAILWHGGEARESRDRFVRLDERQRRQLLSFVRSL